jgi:hypothetical protein
MEASAAETATGGSSVRLPAFSSNHSVARQSGVYAILFAWVIVAFSAAVRKPLFKNRFLKKL